MGQSLVKRGRVKIRDKCRTKQNPGYEDIVMRNPNETQAKDLLPPKMRDPERIERVVNLLKFLWIKYPDLRLGQLIIDITYDTGVDLFYLEDDILEKKIKQVIRKWGS
jgi:hypothetical protein